MITFIVCLLAGLGAGLGTGFAGMSAAAVISPMLIAFLHMDAYQAIGIALASDVLASAVSAYTYGKNKNLDIKNGLVMMFTVMIFTFIASYLASFIPSTTMGGFSTFMTMLLGIKFIVKPVMTTKETMAATDPQKTDHPIHHLRNCHRMHLRLCRCRRRNDDAFDPDIRSGLRIENGSRNQCFHYDFHRPDRSTQPFCDRRHS